MESLDNWNADEGEVLRKLEAINMQKPRDKKESTESPSNLRKMPCVMIQRELMGHPIVLEKFGRLNNGYPSGDM